MPWFRCATRITDNSDQIAGSEEFSRNTVARGFAVGGTGWAVRDARPWHIDFHPSSLGVHFPA